MKRQESIRGELFGGEMEEDVGRGAADEELERRRIGRRVLAGAERESQSARLRQRLKGRRVAESARLVT